MHKQVEENKIAFDGNFSHEFDEISKKIIPAYNAIYELTQHLLRETLGDKVKLLIAGSGTGKESIDYSLANPNWFVTGFDPSEKMLAIAKSKITAASLQTRISLVSGLVDDVSEKNFDAATSILVMHFLRDDGSKLSFLKGIANKLKHGALIIIVDLEGDPNSTEYETLKNAWKNQQLFVRDDGEEVLEEFKIREDEVYCIPQVRTESLLKEVGFVNITNIL